MIPVVHRYLFRALMAPFAITLLFLTFVFVMTRIPDITNMVVNYNTGVSALFSLILFSLPRFLEFTLPMSVMVAVLLTFMRMAGANEIIALKGGGMSIYRLVPPVALFCILATLLTLVVTVWGVPWGKHAFARKGVEMARSNMNVALRERQFNTLFDGVMIYVSSVDVRTARLRDIFIEDARDPESVNITTATHGYLVSDPRRYLYTLKLFNGMINQVNLETGAANEIHFDAYDIHFDMARDMDPAGIGRRDLDELPLAGLLAVIRSGTLETAELNRARMELHEKFSVPVACLALGFLAMALGLRSLSARHAPGFGLAVVFFLGYYLLLALGWSAGETGGYPPVVGMWVPNGVTGLLALHLLRQVAREKKALFPLPRRRPDRLGGPGPAKGPSS